MDGKPMSQADFAEWIENHIPELSAPIGREAEDYEELFGFKTASPNELQMLSRGLQIMVSQNVKSSVVLQSGEGELVFEETHTDKMGNKLTVPGLFILNIAPFFRGAPCRVPVRLRYRVAGGKTTWIFKIYRPDLAITEQVIHDLETAADKTGLPHFQGEPEEA